MLVSQVLVATEGGGGEAGPMAMLLPLALILVVFWVLLIRPQRKKQRELAQTQQTVGLGQEVLTGSGMIGTVTGVDGDHLLVQVAPGVEVRFVRQAIIRVLDANEPTVPETPAAAEQIEPDTKADSSGGSTSAGDSDDMPFTHEDPKKRKN